MPIAFPYFFVAMLVKDEIESIPRHADPVQKDIYVRRGLCLVIRGCGCGLLSGEAAEAQFPHSVIGGASVTPLGPLDIVVQVGVHPAVHIVVGIKGPSLRNGLVIVEIEHGFMLGFGIPADVVAEINAPHTDGGDFLVVGIPVGMDIGGLDKIMFVNQ